MQQEYQLRKAAPVTRFSVYPLNTRLKLRHHDRMTPISFPGFEMRRLNKTLRGFSLLGALLWIAPSYVQASNPVAQAVESALPRGVLKKLEAGILAVAVDSGQVIYEYQADRPLIPASVSKLFTSYAALKRLKPTATFKTTVWQEGRLIEGRLSGNIYIKGGGDPSLVSERMWMLVNELVRSGIKTIQGNIYADDTFYDRERTPETRPSYLTDEAYNAPVGALSFNFNTTTIYVKPADSPGKAPIVYSDPENSYVEIVNQAHTGPAGSRNTLTVKRTGFVKGDIGDTVLLRGSLPLGQSEMRFYRNIVNPSLYAAHMFQTFWERRGMHLEGKLGEKPVPSGATQILSFESLPLWQIVWGLNKFSNNFVADQILKKMGAEAWGAPGTLDKGLKALEDTLDDIGIRPKTYSIVDGSGLTRKTKVTPRQIVRLLIAASKDLSVSAEFMASLGIAGEDGTLRNRLPSQQNTPVRGKTGSLDGVSALAGYTESVDKTPIAFAILLNDRRARYGKMSSWVDKIASAFHKYSRKRE